MFTTISRLSLAGSLLLWLVCAAHGATYYVDPVNGNNANDGLSTNTAWQTIWYANKRGTFPNYVYLTAGDTLYLRGGHYRGNTNSIALQTTGNTGTSNAPITLAAYPGETPIVCDITSPYKGLMLEAKAYWIIDGITYSNCYGAAWFESVTNFVLKNCTFGYSPTSHDYANVGFFNDYSTQACMFNIVTNCLFTQWGTVTADWFGYCNDEGVSLSFGNSTGDPMIWYNLVISNRFIYGAHDHFQLNTAYTVIRGNTFVNAPWFPTNETCGVLHRGGNPDEPNYYRGYGNRQTKPGDAGEVKIDQRTIFEGNLLLYTGPPPDDAGSFGIELGTAHGVYRNNVIAYSLSSGLRFTSLYIGLHHARSNVVYNNVIYGNGQAAVYGWTAASERCGVYTHTTGDTNNYIVNNILWRNWPTNISTASYQRQYIRTNWNADFESFSDPLFVGTNGLQTLATAADWFQCYDPANVPDFRLTASSPCIDAGTWLAYTTSAGSGTTLPVDNSLYFSDGNRIVTGDTIQLQGSTATAIVSSNDWQNNTLYLASSLTWTNGQGVSLPYSGTAPDQGAYEYQQPSTVVRKATLRGSFSLGGKYNAN